MYLLRWGHKVDGSVVIIIFLNETEGELVIDQKVVCSQKKKQRPQMDHLPCTRIKQAAKIIHFSCQRLFTGPETAVTAFIKLLLCDIAVTNFKWTETDGAERNQNVCNQVQ